MTLGERLSSFISLGEALRAFTSQPDRNPPETLLELAVEQAEVENPWFTRGHLLKALGYWGVALEETNLLQWLESYLPELETQKPIRRVGVVMAGNIPLVGFHDMLCVLVTGNKLIARLSSQDARLIPALASLLIDGNTDWQDRIEFVTQEIQEPDAIIATGSTNTARYFQYYFGRYPNIIRKNRTGVAVLDGKETEEELSLLAADIFAYFGLGCRNVSKLFIPKSYDFRAFHRACEGYMGHFHHTKYRNNLDYYKSICLVNRMPFIDGGFYLLLENEQPGTPVSVIHYEAYDHLSQVRASLHRDQDLIQCTVAREGLINGAIPHGTTQEPALGEYADRADTLRFLIEKI